VLTVDYRRLGIRPGEVVLDLGCGGGRHCFEGVRLGARVVALDADGAEVSAVAAMLAALDADTRPPGLGVVARGDARRLPFPDATFDRVIASEVLEHIPADHEAMAELTRVLRPGGTMAVTVPRFGPELVNWALSDRYHSRPGGHVRIYRRSQLVSRLVRAGLRLEGVGYAHALHSPYWWLRCLVGVDREDQPLVAAYHRLLVWDITRAPALTRVAERLLNPVLGKSLVLYLERPR
jgi:SAM-dependent methyltransferase